MKYLKWLLINLILACTISGLITMLGSTLGFFGKNLFYELIKVELTAEIEKTIFFGAVAGIIFFIIILISWPIHIIKAILVTKDIINKKYVDTKESIYTRDLPKYNSAIAGEIVDLKATFEEEYLAGVIELVSKGYIIEKENQLLVDRNKSTEGLLKNEKYILETCEDINQNTYVMKKYGFYKVLKEDMYELGLYNKNTIFNSIINKIIYWIKNNKKYAIVIPYAILFTFAFILFSFFENFLISFILIALISLAIIVYIRNNKLTKIGELEKEKMSKLKMFLEQETNFKNKGEEERELWGRYSAFAVAFGLNAEMKNDIYHKIMKKS